jgi:hypothetical protein
MFEERSLQKNEGFREMRLRSENQERITEAADSAVSNYIFGFHGQMVFNFPSWIPLFRVLLVALPRSCRDRSAAGSGPAPTSVNNIHLWSPTDPETDRNSSIGLDPGPPGVDRQPQSADATVGVRSASIAAAEN